MRPPTVAFQSGPPARVQLLDQTRLPHGEHFLDLERIDDLIDAIRRLCVRGAPAIGIAAGYGVALELDGTEPDTVLRQVHDHAERLAAARPTAQDLFTALQRVTNQAEEAHAGGADAAGIRSAVIAEAEALAVEDVERCQSIGEHALGLLQKRAAVLTHCNAGALATGGIGTALAPLFLGHDRGYELHVWVDETRPLLQGARLTAWELGRAGIAHTLLPDSAAASLVASGRVDAIRLAASA